MINLQLETTSTCNAACIFCPYPELARWGGKMDMDLYKSIIDQTINIPEISRITLHGLGEPLLDPHLEARIEYVKQVNPVPVSIYTNGVYLTPARFDALKAAGLHSLVISLNAVRADQHDLIMGLKDKFDTVVANCDYAIAQSGVAIEIHAVVTGDTFTMEDKHIFDSRWSTHSLVVVEGNWAGDKRQIRDFNPADHCHRATQHIYVLYNGTVSACCFDPTAKLKFGDLSKETIKQMYNSEKYTRFREDHSKNQADKWAICKVCTRI